MDASAHVQRYEVLDLIGQGGFGRVYRARRIGERGFAKEVALKVATDVGGDAVARLRDEAKMLALVRHRAIVHVDDLMRVDGGWALVMELVDGVDLGRLLELGPVPLGPAAEIVAELAGALHAAWVARGPSGRQLRLVHRDIKPANVLVTVRGETKLLDFGVARANFEARESLTLDSMYGSMAYMAPERLSQRDHPNSDVYSLGVVLWELVSGGRYGRTSERRDLHERRVRQMLDDSPELPAPAVALIERMLAFDPDARPGARDVERLAAGLARGFTPTLRDWAEEVVPELLARPREGPAPDAQLVLAPAAEVQLPVVARPAVPVLAAEVAPAPEVVDIARLPTFTAPEPRASSLEPLPTRSRGADLWLLLGVTVAIGATSLVALAAVAVWLVLPEADHAPIATVSAQMLIEEPDSEPVPEAPPEAVAPPPEPTPIAAPAAPQPAVARSAPAPRPRAAPAPRPDPAPAAVPLPVPAPPAAAAAAPPPPPATEQRSLVQVRGDVRRAVLLAADGTSWQVPGAVPAGVYTVRLGEADAGRVTVGAGQVVSVLCASGHCAVP